MFSLNRAQIIGNLTRDPEIRTLPSGQTVTSFAVATNRRWRDKDGNTKEETQYHEVSAWGRLAELASQMLAKGKKVYVEGRLQTSSWDGQDGVKRNRTEIVAENFIPLSPRSETVLTDVAEVETKSSEDKKNLKKKEAVDDGDTKADDEINLDDIPF